MTNFRFQSEVMRSYVINGLYIRLQDWGRFGLDNSWMR